MTDEINDRMRRLPVNELDLTFMTTEPAWGREVEPELYHRVVKITEDSRLDENGNRIINAEPLWGILSYYTRDIRLGNLSSYNGEYVVCQFWLDLAGDLLRAGHVQSFLSALSRVISILELSQSKGGFLRKRQGTVTAENIQTPMDPAKKSIIGGKKME